jgi:hypothetical protein
MLSLRRTPLVTQPTLLEPERPDSPAAMHTGHDRAARAYPQEHTPTTARAVHLQCIHPPRPGPSFTCKCTRPPARGARAATRTPDSLATSGACDIAGLRRFAVRDFL